MSKCDVCGRETETFVACSACGGESYKYCEACLDAGAEPWDALVFYVSMAGEYPQEVNEAFQEIVRNTCKRLGRTEEEFILAVKSMEIDY